MLWSVAGGAYANTCLLNPWWHYPVHDKNHFFEQPRDNFTIYRYRLAINALFEHLGRKFSYNVERLAEFPRREFYTIARPTFRQLKHY